MVYLVLAVALLSLGGLVAVWLEFRDIRAADTEPSRGQSPTLSVLMDGLGAAEDRIRGLADRLSDQEKEISLVRAHVDEVLTRADTRFKAARSAEERARRMGADVDDEDEVGEDQEEMFARLVAANSEPDEPQQTSSWDELEAHFFSRKHGRV